MRLRILLRMANEIGGLELGLVLVVLVLSVMDTSNRVWHVKVALFCTLHCSKGLGIFKSFNYIFLNIKSQQ